MWPNLPLRHQLHPPLTMVSGSLPGVFLCPNDALVHPAAGHPYRDPAAFGGLYRAAKGHLFGKRHRHDGCLQPSQVLCLGRLQPVVGAGCGDPLCHRHHPADPVCRLDAGTVLGKAEAGVSHGLYRNQ